MYRAVSPSDLTAGTVLYCIVHAVLSKLMWIKLENEKFYRKSSHELHFGRLKTCESDDKRRK